MSLGAHQYLVIAVTAVIGSALFAALGVGQTSQASAPSRMSVVHAQMSQILQQEAPGDIRQMSFERLAGQQSCYMRGNGHVASAVLGAGPHQGVIRAGFHREGEAGLWVNDGTADSYWVEVHHPNEADANDQYGLSSEDFRAVVRECVQAVRDNVKAERAPHQTLQERRDSWGVTSGADHG